jgi:competence protein ComEC
MINKRLGSYALQVIHICNPAFCTGMVVCMVSFAWWPTLPLVQVLTDPFTMFNMIVIVSISSVLIMLSILLRAAFKNEQHMYKLHYTSVYFITGLIIACVYCNWIGHQYIYAINSIEFDTPMWVQGEVTTLQNTDYRSSKKSSIVLRVTHINTSAVSPMLVRLNWYYPQADLRQGQHWRLLVKLKPARGLANQAGFDYQRYLIGQQIVATGYIKPHANNLWLNGEISLAQHLSLQLEHAVSPHHQWINALMLGHKHALTSVDKQLIRETGTAHLFVISGMHIGVVAAWIALCCHFIVNIGTLLLRRSGIDVAGSMQAVTLSMILVGAFAYCTLLGFTIPMLRAVTVITLWLLLNYWQVKISFLHKYLLCLVVVCVVFPMSSFNLGFWLSFAAVSAIVLVCHVISFTPQTWGQKIRAFIGLQIALSLLLIPINVLFFQQWLPASILANLFAIPWVTLVLVPLCMLTLLFSVLAFILPDYMSILGMAYQGGIIVLDYSFGLLIAGLKLFSNTEFMTTVFAPVPLALSFGGSLLLLIVILTGLIFHRQWYAQLLLILVVIGGIFALQPHKEALVRFFTNTRSNSIVMSLHIMDVGQGSAALLLAEDEALVFDVGDDFGDNFNMVDSVLKPFLLQSNIATIRTTYISHNDKDHVGGIDRLISAYPLMSVVNEQNGCVQGYQQTFHAAQLTVLWPPQNMPIAKKNDRSCVMHISIGSQRILMTGDIEGFAEAQLVIAHDQGLINLSSDILIVPHHGSASSSSIAFVQRVNPQYAFISAGFMNRYQLPKESILQRYRQADIAVLNTAQVGQI